MTILFWKTHRIRVQKKAITIKAKNEIFKFEDTLTED